MQKRLLIDSNAFVSSTQTGERRMSAQTGERRMSVQTGERRMSAVTSAAQNLTSERKSCLRYENLSKSESSPMTFLRRRMKINNTKKQNRIFKTRAHFYIVVYLYTPL